MLASNDVRFGPFSLNLSNRRLRHNVTTVPLTPKEADLLVLLAASRGKPVSRDEIMDTLWRLQKATDDALAQTVYRLRRTLKAFDDTDDYVRTVPGIGYHLVAPAPVDGATADLGFRDPAFRLYQHAMFTLEWRSHVQIEESIATFESALALNPAYVPALTGLARAYTKAGMSASIDPATAYYRAKKAIAQALALDPVNAEAFGVLSRLALIFDADLVGARAAAEHAALLTSQPSRAASAMVWQLLARQDHEGALAEADRALRMHPSDARLTALLGIALYLSRRYDEACVHLAEALEFPPMDVAALYYYACAHYMCGRFGTALALLDRMDGASFCSKELALRGCIAIRQEGTSARTRFNAAISARPFRSDLSLAMLDIASDRVDAAASTLARALDTREPGLILVTIDPLYGPLRSSHPALVSAIRKGRPVRCDRCAGPLAGTHPRMHELRLCDDCAE